MQVHVIGRNRAEMCKVKNKDVEKHFFSSRRMLFKVYADGLTRCIVTKYGHWKMDEEIIVYKENAIVPYHPKNVCYADWKICAEIDEHKKMLKIRQSPLILIAKGYKDLKKALGGSVVTIGILAILAYALFF